MEQRLARTQLTDHRIERYTALSQFGAIAQLVERFVRNEEVRGSIPLSSTNAMSRDIPDTRTRVMGSGVLVFGGLWGRLGGVLWVGMCGWCRG